MELTHIIKNFVDLHCQVTLLRDSSAKTQLDHTLREIRRMIDGTMTHGVARLVPQSVMEFKTEIADMQQKIRYVENIIRVASAKRAKRRGSEHGWKLQIRVSMPCACSCGC